MTAEKLFWLIIGLFILGFIEGIVANFMPGFQLALVYGFQSGILGGAITSKLINDTKEMKYGCANGKKPD